MKTTTYLGQNTVRRLAFLAALLVISLAPATRPVGAAELDWPTAAKDPKDPRFLAVPAEVIQPKKMAQLNTATPAAPAPSPAPALVSPPAAELPAPPAPAAAPPNLNPQLSPHRQNASIETYAGGKKSYSFEANQLEVRTALAQFARANNLNIVPDNDVVGTVTVSLHDLPLQQVMRALLEAADCSWQEEEGLIRVRNFETRMFSVDYLRLTRSGLGMSSAQLGSGGSSGGGGGGGMGGGGGGMGGGGSGGSGGGSSGGNILSYGNSSVTIQGQNNIPLWIELKDELKILLTEQGKNSLAVNMTAGLVQVSDRPSALKKVQEYLSGVDKSIHRQVDIESRIYSVTLNNQFQFGIDWGHVAQAYGGSLGFGGSTLPMAIGGTSLGDSAIRGLPTQGQTPVGSPAVSGGNASSLVFQNFNTEAAVNALELQGKVEVISKPRLRTLNNQTALIKVGEDKPFFNTSSYVQQSGTTQPMTSENTVVSSVTIGTILSVTPQISGDGWVSMDISPVLTSLIGTVYAPASGGSTSGSTTSGTTAPDLETKQASTIVRVRDGNTIVLGGLIQTTAAKQLNKIPLLGDIPLLGKLFTGTFDYKQKQELVLFVTPRIVSEDEQSAKVPADEKNSSLQLIEPSVDHPVRVLEVAPTPQWPQVR